MTTAIYMVWYDGGHDTDPERPWTVSIFEVGETSEDDRETMRLAAFENPEQAEALLHSMQGGSRVSCACGEDN